MKTIKLSIASLFSILGFLLISVNGISQDTRLNRQERKEVREAQRAANFYILDSLLNSKSFVLEADYLQGRYGNRIPVSSDLNFIRVNSSTGVLQTGSPVGIGYNGVGGVTVEGSINSWGIYKDTKRLSFNLHFSINSNIGHYDISMDIGSDNNASATITGLGTGRLTWEGHLKTIDNSRVFKGQNTI